MKKYAVIIFAFLFSLNSFAQNNPSPLKPTIYGVVYAIPATKNVKVKSGVTYFKDERSDLTIDANWKTIIICVIHFIRGNKLL